MCFKSDGKLATDFKCLLINVFLTILVCELVLLELCHFLVQNSTLFPDIHSINPSMTPITSGIEYLFIY